jgi:glutathione S-transferase
MDTAKPHQEFVPRDGHYDSTFRSRIKVSQLFRAAREQLQQFCSDQKTTTTTTTTSEENLYQQQQLLEYVIEWEDIVTADLGQQLYILKKLEKNKTRCEKKNKKLQHWTEVASKDGASISGRFHTRRLVRNQDKLSEALQVYHVKEREIVFLLQQVTKHGWKDLYPLVEATLELEMQRMKEEEDAFGRPFPAAVDTIDSVIGQVEKEDCMLRTLFDVPHSMHGNSWTVLDVLKDRSKPYLFVDDASPYAARVWIAMLEKEADPRQPTGFHLMHVCSALGGKDPGFCLLQQLGVDETPALVHNGNVLSGSASVAEYIDATILHPSNNNNNGSLTPRHPVSRYNMNVFIDHHSKIEAFFFALLDTGDQTSRQSALGLWMLLEEDLNKFPGPYLCGNQFTLADIHIFPFVEHILQVRRKQKKQQHGYSIPSTLQALQSWYDKVSSRPSVQVVIGNRTAQFVESSK